jgi:radical SAM superfamily enzyme YgiQ (UPF0313 family)
MTNQSSILVLWPPSVPTYFNAGHRLGIFRVSAYLRKMGFRALAIDAGALNMTWKDIGRVLLDVRPDVLAIQNEFGEISAAANLSEFARRLLPSARQVTFGRLSYQEWTVFKRFDLDGIASSGDYETSVLDFVRWSRTADSIPAGVAVKGDDAWRQPGVGRYLESAEWIFPDITEIPYDAYDRLYADDGNKFCGVPDRRELVVPVARGCPINCSFCEVPRQQGNRERRSTVDEVVEYIEKSFRDRHFDYIAFYAPTFTLNRKWVLQLCEVLESKDFKYPWKCATTLSHLDDELVSAMGRSGCIRISVGLETLDARAKETNLPVAKRRTEEDLAAVAGACSRANIELNCFVIVGLPQDRPEGVRHTIQVVEGLGARVRPTLYTPYHEIREDMDINEIASFDRMNLPSIELSADQAAEMYRLAFGIGLKTTTVMENIPTMPTLR